jgi:hypothetical protein
MYPPIDYQSDKARPLRTPWLFIDDEILTWG